LQLTARYAAGELKRLSRPQESRKSITAKSSVASGSTFDQPRLARRTSPKSAQPNCSFSSAEGILAER